LLTVLPLRAASIESDASSSPPANDFAFPRTGVATVNENRFEVEPATRTAEVTLTRSPGRNGLVGRYVAPRPSLAAISFPGWRPLWLPTTRTAPTRAGATPRNVIVLDGETVRHPGPGKVTTAPGAVGLRELEVSTDEKPGPAMARVSTDTVSETVATETSRRPGALPRSQDPHARIHVPRSFARMAAALCPVQNQAARPPFQWQERFTTTAR
jgi:hypothetical protein